MADKGRTLKQRIWLVASVSLYGTSLIVPCLNWGLSAPKSPLGDLTGWDCLIAGVLGAPAILPAVCLFPNALLWILWWAAAKEIPLTLLQAWSVAASAAVSLWLTQMTGAEFRYGCWLWLASFVAGSYAASFDEMEKIL